MYNSINTNQGRCQAKARQPSRKSLGSPRIEFTRCALYRRVSSKEHLKGSSLDDQLERLQLIAKLENCEVVADYCDEGYSGGTDERPELQRLMADARLGTFNLLLITKIDRLFRDSRLLHNYVHELQSHGVALLIHDEGIDSRKPGIANIILSLFAAMAQWERQRIAERTKDARAYRTARGQWSSGRVTFGLRFDKERKELVVYEPEAVVVRELFSLYVNEELGTVRLAERLNRLGRLTPRLGRRKHDYWAPGAVRHILTHWGYIGGPNEHWPFKTPQIIEPHVFYQAQQRLLANRHIRPCQREPRECQGLLRCWLCGHTLRVAFDHGKPKYECPSRRGDYHLDGSPRCTLPRFDAEVLELFVTEAIKKFFTYPHVLVPALQQSLAYLKDELSAVEQRLRPIKGELVELDRKAQALDAKLDVGRITPDLYKASMGGLNARKRELHRAQREQDPAMLSARDEVQTRLAVIEQLITKLQTTDEWVSLYLGSAREVLIRYGLVAELVPARELVDQPAGPGGREADGLLNGCFLQLVGLASSILGAVAEYEGLCDSPGCRSSHCPRSRQTAGPGVPGCRRLWSQ